MSQQKISRDHYIAVSKCIYDELYSKRTIISAENVHLLGADVFLVL